MTTETNECREAFINEGFDPDIDARDWTIWQLCWNRRPAPATEAVGGLTDVRKQTSEVIAALADIVKLGDQSHRESDPEVILRQPVMTQVIRIREAVSAINRTLNQRLATPSDQQAKDAALLRDLKWRIDDIRDDLMGGGRGHSVYGIDEWSVPAQNLKKASNIIDAALAAGQGEKK